MYLDFNLKAKGARLWEMFTQRVKYSDLCVRKDSNGNSKDLPEGSNAGVKEPITMLVAIV